ncbi:MAG: energy-coupling factor transporter transmembrane component T [bacterium]|nr:energy-coupling factor transporter transmembrane component T [bacterium]
MDIEYNMDLNHPVDLMVYRFDARAKIIFLFSIFIVIFSIKTWAGILIFCLFYGSIILLSKIPLEKLFSGVKTWLIIIILLCMFPLFVIKGRQFIHIGWINITYEGIRESEILFAKLFLTSLGAKILTATTSISQIILAFKYFSYPLKIFGFSDDEMGLIISVGIGFIRFFTKEAKEIIQIGNLRGIDWNPGNIFRQPSKFLFLIQAIITRMYIIGFNIEESLELYGYNQCGIKTSFYELKWKLADSIPIFCIILLGLAVYYVN